MVAELSLYSRLGRNDMSQLARGEFQQDKQKHEVEVSREISGFLAEFVKTDVQGQIATYAEIFSSPDSKKRTIGLADSAAKLAVDLNALRLFGVPEDEARYLLLDRGNTESLVSRLSRSCDQLKKDKEDIVCREINSIISPETGYHMMKAVVPQAFSGLEFALTRPEDDVNNQADYDITLGQVEVNGKNVLRRVRIQMKATKSRNFFGATKLSEYGKSVKNDIGGNFSGYIKEEDVFRLRKSTSDIVRCEEQVLKMPRYKRSYSAIEINTGVILVPYIVSPYYEIEKTNPYGIVFNREWKNQFEASLLDSNLFFTKAA